MPIPIYQVDAFAERVFSGNPAAVCLLESWLDDATLQAIALENNLSETAFLAPRANDPGSGGGFDLRWFTPATEVDLCGHATLASGYVVMTHVRPEAQDVVFHTKSGPLRVERKDPAEPDRLTMILPRLDATPCDPPSGLVEALGASPDEVLVARKGRNLMAVYATEREVAALRPDGPGLMRLDALGVIVTAPGGEGSGVDFVSRYFAPAAGIYEDPVTGSAHCTLAPFWAKRLGKDRLSAAQISARRGDLDCEVAGETVVLTGRVRPFLEGRIRTGEDR